MEGGQLFRQAVVCWRRLRQDSTHARTLCGSSVSARGREPNWHGVPSFQSDRQHVEESGSPPAIFFGLVSRSYTLDHSWDVFVPLPMQPGLHGLCHRWLLHGVGRLPRGVRLKQVPQAGSTAYGAHSRRRSARGASQLVLFLDDLHAHLPGPATCPGGMRLRQPAHGRSSTHVVFIDHQQDSSLCSLRDRAAEACAGLPSDNTAARIQEQEEKDERVEGECAPKQDAWHWHGMMRTLTHVMAGGAGTRQPRHGLFRWHVRHGGSPGAFLAGCERSGEEGATFGRHPAWTAECRCCAASRAAVQGAEALSLRVPESGGSDCVLLSVIIA
eukprot:363712-Chlamydomonas_euryale.AAC.18